MLFAKPLKFIFNQKFPITCKQSTKVYDLNKTRPCPKRLKLRLDYSKEEFWNQLFGPIVNKNGYKYCFSDDEKLIKHIKEALGSLLKAGEDEHIIVFKKSKVTNDVWLVVTKKNDCHKCKLKFLIHQVSNMPHGREEPTFKPFPICFNVDNDLGLLA